jgi:cyclopropane fatty-acyl-phospholipid synthase-like methyltransferase
MDNRMFAPATQRNREPILAVARKHFPKAGTVLEVGAGSGEHAVFLAGHFGGLRWHPTDPDADARASIDAWREHTHAENVAAAAELDVCSDTWPLERADVIVNVNMIHIAPWRACVGLMRGAGRCLSAGGLLMMYGPYMIDGAHTAPSNEAFDQSLRSRNPDWGVRDLREVVAEAEGNGLQLTERIAMPANNFTLVFRRGD